MSTESLQLTPHSSTAPVARAAAVKLLSPLVREALPETANDAELKASDVDEGAPLSRAVEELNRYVVGSRTDLKFSIDREAGQVVVSIIDSENGQVLRQMPSVEALRIARYLEHDRLGLIRQQA